jgi:hypothetical protein
MMPLREVSRSAIKKKAMQTNAAIVEVGTMSNLSDLRTNRDLRATWEALTA